MRICGAEMYVRDDVPVGEMGSGTRTGTIYRCVREPGHPTHGASYGCRFQPPELWQRVLERPERLTTDALGLRPLLDSFGGGWVIKASGDEGLRVSWGDGRDSELELLP